MTVQEWLGEENQLGIDIWQRKYQHEDESFDEWLDRVSGGSKAIADLILQKKFLFGGRILANRGLHKMEGRKITYSNCYVVSPPEDNIESIFECAKKLARTYSYGGGCGVDISKLAPKGARIHNAAKETSGAVSFMDLFSDVTGLIGQNGRRGALMISLDCKHPDVLDFIGVKTDLSKVTTANISIRISDEFMKAVEEDKDFDLEFTRNETGEVIKKTVNAREVFRKIAETNRDYAEPGALFWDRIKGWNLLANTKEFEFAGTNPCITGDTLIFTGDGRYLVPISKLYTEYMEDPNNFNVSVLTWDKELNRTRFETINWVQHSGVKEVYGVTLNDGSAIKATMDHKFIRSDGTKVPLSDLSVGDKLMPFYAKRYNRADGDCLGVGTFDSYFGDYNQMIHEVHHIGEFSVDNYQDNTNFGREVSIKSIVALGETHVYDMNVFRNHNFAVATNLVLSNDYEEFDGTLSSIDKLTGIIIGNCAEEPLPAGGSCLLGSINLSEFVDKPFTDNAHFDYSSFTDTVEDSVIALNEVLDEGLELHPLQEQRDSVRNWRQIGLGIMGLADCLLKLGIRYGSKEAVIFSHHVGEVMRNSAVLASSRLASLLGPYPKYDEGAVCSTPYFQLIEDPEVFNSVKKHGLRNSQLLTIAPTGTLSTMLGVSGGIEPIFANFYMRRTESLYGHSKSYKVYTNIVKQYMDLHGIETDLDLPDYFVTAMTLDYKERIHMQGAWQNYIDASISSTINVPNSFTVDQTEDLYMYAWKNGLKGVTIFRDGCARLGILTLEPEEDNKNELKRGDIVTVSDGLIGKKRKLITGCGSLHCIALFDRDTGELRETFLSKGSTGGCNNFMVGLSRMISLSARGGISIENIVDQLSSTGSCPSYAVRRATKKDTSPGACCPMAVGNALMEMYHEMQDELKSVRVSKVDSVESEEPIYEDTAKAYCPECGEPLVFEEGCNICKNCGYSKCS